MHTKRLFTLLLSSSAALLAAAPVASADSIAYIKGGDVWLTTMDASREYQVTSSGGYTTVSQADDGTLLATAGSSLRRLDRTGHVLSEIATPVSDNVGVMTFTGPSDSDVSPDGTKAAYGFIEQGIFQDPTTGEVSAEIRNGYGFTKSDALTGFTDAGYKYDTGWDAPEWADDDHVLVSNGPGYPSDPFEVRTVSTGQSDGWFTDPGNMHPMEATISRNLRVIAAVHGPDRSSLRVYRVGDQKLFGPVFTCFDYTLTGGVSGFASPTVSGDGRTLFFATAAGLETAPLPDMTSSCGTGVNSRDVIPGGSNPDWGPADVPAPRPTPAPAPTPGPTPAPGPTTPTGPGTPGTPSTAPTKLAATAARTALAKALKRGLVLQVRAPGGRLTATARVHGKVVARGSATVTSSGKVALRITFTKAARRSLAHAGTAVLKVRIVGGAATKTIVVRLTR
jgi:hypothetical protein